jgi:hypothetical protein
MVRKYRWTIWMAAAAVTLFAATPARGVLVDMAGHWAAPLMGALEARGVVNGDESGRFDPEAPLTRAQLAKLLVIGLGHEDDAKLLSAYPSRFRDIPSWHWARGYIESLAESAIVEGYPGDLFAPADTVNRAQMAAVLVRAMGLNDQVRTMRFEPTTYTDDIDIPAWARGAVHVARAGGFMEGFADGSFRPLQPVTRAEGAVALSRLLGARGQLFHLTGTLVRWDSATRRGTVRDELGNEQAFTAASDAQYFRGGVAATAGQVRILDQVWLVLGNDGRVRFLDARHEDVLLNDLTVRGTRVTGTDGDGAQRSYTLQPGALVFVNGRLAAPEKAQGLSEVYLVLDRVSGEVRVLDGVHVAAEGWLLAYTPATRTLSIQTENELKRLPVAPDVMIVLDGERVQVSDLQVGDQLVVAVNENGAVVYMHVER